MTTAALKGRIPQISPPMMHSCNPTSRRTRREMSFRWCHPSRGVCRGTSQSRRSLSKCRSVDGSSQFQSTLRTSAVSLPPHLKEQPDRNDGGGSADERPRESSELVTVIEARAVRYWLPVCIDLMMSK
mmetsp:Transcript_15819/g.52921  ORF Transcript_15819/g.52921 Transcript_15819/m.52921 type:complete len:128 (-) Transcript_15819:60-443(-)